MLYIVGLGNPGEEYAQTRHNVGRMAVEFLAEEFGASDGAGVTGFKADKVLKADKVKCEIPIGSTVGAKIGSTTSTTSKTMGAKKGNEPAMLILPNTFMNKSGASVVPLINSPKKLEQLIVVHDDIDLPLGQIKIVFNRGSGGNKGVESIKRALKSEAFVRIKIGVIPTTPGGKLKKPKAGEPIVDFILGDFQKNELLALKKTFGTVAEIIEEIASNGHLSAMNKFNSLA